MSILFGWTIQPDDFGGTRFFLFHLLHSSLAHDACTGQLQSVAAHPYKDFSVKLKRSIGTSSHVILVYFEISRSTSSCALFCANIVCPVNILPGLTEAVFRVGGSTSGCVSYSARACVGPVEEGKQAG